MPRELDIDAAELSFSENEYGVRAWTTDLPRWIGYIALGFKPKEIERSFLESRIPHTLILMGFSAGASLVGHGVRTTENFANDESTWWIYILSILSLVLALVNFIGIVFYTKRVSALCAKYPWFAPIYIGGCTTLQFGRFLVETNHFALYSIDREEYMFLFLLSVVNIRTFVFRHAVWVLLACLASMIVSLFFLPADYFAEAVPRAKQWIWVLILFWTVAVIQEYFERYAFIVQLRLKVENKARRKAEDEARRQKSETLTTLAKMFHEIRTPLGCLLGLHDLLMLTKCDRERSDYARAIQSSGSHLMQLLNDILDYSNLRVGKVTLNESWNNPIAVMNDVIRSFTSSVAEKQLELDADMDQSFVGHMKFDKTRVHQICSNFISNGIKFTPEGGRISFRVRCELDFCRPQGRILDVRVTDTGVGMSDDQKERIFEEFYQVDSSRSRSAGGAGLGLSIASNLAKVMHGQVGVESALNNGSTFSFQCFFPVSIGSCFEIGQTDTDSSSADGSEHPTLKVLLVDDTPLNIRVFQAQLQRWGCSVITARNGRTAIEIMDEEGTEVDAIIMDVHMPEMDGLETSRNIVDRHPSVPIFGLTADLTVNEYSVVFQASGMRHVLYKPLTEQHVRTIRMMSSNPTNTSSRSSGPAPPSTNPLNTPTTAPGVFNPTPSPGHSGFLTLDSVHSGSLPGALNPPSGPLPVATDPHSGPHLLQVEELILED